MLYPPFVCLQTQPPFSFKDNLSPFSLQKNSMATSSTSLSLSFDSALQPILFHSSHHPSCFPTTFLSAPRSSSLSIHFRRRVPPLSPPQAVDSSVKNPTPGPFLDPTTLEQLKILGDFHQLHEFEHGSLEIRPMEDSELDNAVTLLAESFIESMWLPDQYAQLLAILVNQYVVERRRLMPHMVVLVGLYKSRGEEEEAQIACTAEVSFDALGANAAPPTPSPPRECPYICNMTVKKPLRRKGIGRKLLKACEELIIKMKAKSDVYLHCRVVDKIPFSMYKKAGYKVVKTDSILVWLTAQRRKYLMHKKLPQTISDNISDSDDDHS
ncbi:GCN5-related N-acetyltransferase 5, chloroplastic [Typha angustifolia]|uniref:GCN5-related N-acetyltransferase 5, chloroplastic n=1 Tax=Typha angustifolia TaxID=59011 RepID=UPI003C2BBC5D